MSLSPVSSVQLAPIGSLTIASAADSNRSLSDRKSLVPIEATKTTKPKQPATCDYLPDELLIALAQPAPPPERLGPPTRLPSLNVSTVAVRKAAANVWSFPKQREKLKHLLACPPCVCGAGHDISFLYDVPKKTEGTTDKPDLLDPSHLRARDVTRDDRKNLPFTLSASLIPEEYHIVRNKGVSGLECLEDEYTTLPEDHEKHVVVFPSMNPASRFEVLQLRDTLQDMLDRCGVHDDVDQLTAPTQMHRLLELIKKEQNIYNIIFHELIRQVSIECLERGELLSTIRSHYADLLSRVPKQVKSLHDEVLAQRALDRRLTEELMKFKATVSELTSELNAVKEHDQQVTQQALRVQEDLKAALSESSKNSNMLAEYRDLYELQRKRLEKNVDLLSYELQTWCDVSYTMAGKVIEEYCLNSTRRLCISERAWSRIADHFTIMLNDRDMADLMAVQASVDAWVVTLDDFDRDVRRREEDVKHQLKLVVDDLQKWLKWFTSTADARHGSKKSKVAELTVNKMAALSSDLKNWEQTLVYVGEIFGGESVLTSQEVLTDLRRHISGWTNSAVHVFLRHDSGATAQHPAHVQMIRINHEVDTLLKQYSCRITGENGVINIIQSVANSLEACSSRIVIPLRGEAAVISLGDQQRALLIEQMEFWVSALIECIANIGSLMPQNSGRTSESDTDATVVEKGDVVNHVHKWLKITHHSIDSDDAKMIEQVSVLHRQMIRWMTDALISLVPALCRQSNEAKEAGLHRTVSVEHLFDEAKTLSVTVTEFTRTLSRHCSHFVLAERQTRLDRHDESADHEHLELIRLTSECEEWIKLTGFVLHELSQVHPLTINTSRASSADKMPYDDTKSHSTVMTPPLGDSSRPSGAADDNQINSPGDGHKDSQHSTTGDDTISATTAVEPIEYELSVDGVLHTGLNVDPRRLPTPVITGTGPREEVLLIGDDDFLENRTSEIEAQEPTTAIESVKADSHDVLGVDSGISLNQHSTDKLEVIGYDSSTRTVALTPPPPVLTGQSDGTVASAASGYAAFASVQFLQQQLVLTESRAQEAEERAVAAEAALVEALEKLHSLEQHSRSATETPLVSETPTVLSAAPSELSLLSLSATSQAAAAREPTTPSATSSRERSSISSHSHRSTGKSRSKKKN